MNDATQDQDAIRIERSFDAPADLVWLMWTDPEHFAAWYGPDGATVSVAKMDVRVGGARLVSMEMTTPDGSMTMWFGGEHLEVVEARRLVYTEAITDERGTPPAPPEVSVPGGHPAVTEVQVTLHAVGDRTEMVLTHVGVPGGSPGAVGWRMAIDKLASRVEAQAT